MKTIRLKTAIILIILYSSAIAQNNKIIKDDINAIVKQTGDSLPTGWTVRVDTGSRNEFIIQSEVIDLLPDMTSNDPPKLKEKCEIFVLIVPRISPDSISSLRKKNKELQDYLPPQNSKENLNNWYKQNEETLRILDSEPTHYDKIFSYRIKCRRLPQNEKEKAAYDKIMSYLNRQYKKY